VFPKEVDSIGKDEEDRSTLIDEVGIELEELRRAGDQLDEAVAARFGLNRTDLRCWASSTAGAAWRPVSWPTRAGSPGGDHDGARPSRAGRVREPGRRPTDRRRVLVVSTVATREIGARVYGEVELAGRTELEQRSGRSSR